MYAKAKNYEKKGFSHAAYLMRQYALELPDNRMALGPDPHDNEGEIHQFSPIIIVSRKTSTDSVFRYKRKYFNKLELY